MPDALLDEIFEELEVEENRPACQRCGRLLVTERHWQAADEAERWELWLDGYEAYPRGRNAKSRCNPCSHQSGPLRPDELEIRDARRFRVLNYIKYRDQGLNRRQIADKLGITLSGLNRNIVNWKNRGWV